MFFLPYAKIEITSDLTREEIEDVLKDSVEENVFSFRRPKVKKYFVGQVSLGKFWVKRAVYTSSKRIMGPVVYGDIEQVGGGTKIKLSLQVDALLAVLAVFVYVGVVFAVALPGLTFLLRALFLGENVHLLRSFPEMYLFEFLASFLKLSSLLYLLTMFFFNVEADMVLDRLKKLLEVDME